MNKRSKTTQEKVNVRDCKSCKYFVLDGKDPQCNLGDNLPEECLLPEYQLVMFPTASGDSTAALPSGVNKK